MVSLDSPSPIRLLLSFYHLWQVQLLCCLSFPRVLYLSHCLCLHSKKQSNCHFPSAMTALKRALPAKSFNGNTSHAFLALSAASQIQSVKASTNSSLYKCDPSKIQDGLITGWCRQTCIQSHSSQSDPKQSSGGPRVPKKNGRVSRQRGQSLGNQKICWQSVQAWLTEYQLFQ